MPQLEPTVETIRDMTPIPQAIYLAEVVAHEEKVSKPNKQTGATSMNDFVTFKITEGEQHDRKIKKCFNEQVQTPGLRFFAALGAKIEPGAKLDWEKTIGRPLKISVIKKLFEGRTVNDIDDFLPAE